MTRHKLALMVAIGLSLISNTVLASSKNSLNALCNDNNYLHILVNKEYALTKDFKPDSLRMPNVKFASPGNIQKNYLEENASYALENLFNAAKKDNITLIAVSGYRSYEYQNKLYNRAIKNEGINQNSSAKPNESEHRLGLAMDLNIIDQSFENTKEFKWLSKNAHKYGWIIRYPKGKTAVTGYIYEPWHIRYLGVELATEVYESGLTLEEFAEQGGCCGLVRKEPKPFKAPLIIELLK